MNITELSPGQMPAWDSYVLGHPLGNAYLLSGFGQAVKKGYGFSVHNFTAWANGRICGVLPLVRMGGGKCLVSLPYCDVAGILADSPEVERALLSFALKTGKASRSSLISIRSTRPIAGLDPGMMENQEKVRMVLELPSSPERLMASFKAKVRSQIKKPMRDGLAFELGGLKLLDSFYAVFRENMRDLGSPVHHRTFLRNILSSYGTRAHLGLVRLPDRTPAAAGIILCHPRMVSIPWASSLKRWNRLNPNMLLYWGLLNYACSAGFPRFDFGRSTPGQGTYRFKQQWGASPRPIFWADFDPERGLQPRPKEKDMGKARLRSSIERMIVRTPVPLMTWAGSHCRKYISL